MGYRDDLDYGMDPQGRMRFPGIYVAKVIDVDDPLKKSRIKVKVQQSTANEVTGWAVPCLPVTSNANHPDHIAHTAQQVADLLRTTTANTSSVGGDYAHNHSIANINIIPRTTGTLKHPHKTVANTTQKWNDSQETNATAEHTPHRIVPKVGQLVWVMFIAGDPEYPVWMGVQL